MWLKICENFRTAGLNPKFTVPVLVKSKSANESRQVKNALQPPCRFVLYFVFPSVFFLL